MTFFIPFRLPGMNDIIAANRWHRMNGAKLKRQTQEDIGMIIKSQCRAVFTETVKLSYTWVEPNRKRDLDNIMSAQKFIQDSLVEMGIIKNDGWKQISGISHKFTVDKDKPGVWVKIEEEI